MITKIVSGGQTRADRGGLDAIIHCEIPHGGWCPYGRKAVDGIIPMDYHLREMQSAEYLPRTQANVIDSDTTMNFIYGPKLGGTLKAACRYNQYRTQEIQVHWHGIVLKL